MPYTRWLGGEVTVARDMIAACKEICGEDVLLKVILETGRLREPAKIQAASRDVIAAGADFVKTSTGKVEVSATLEAAEAMLRAIKESGREVGIQSAGCQIGSESGWERGCQYVKKQGGGGRF